ncbi:MAG: hypothetical protein E7663_05980 [Ruminococcaceae bacterium]|nr:hypothetical protein [Oscillospiraceae bacterium]
MRSIGICEGIADVRTYREDAHERVVEGADPYRGLITPERTVGCGKSGARARPVSAANDRRFFP